MCTHTQCIYTHICVQLKHFALKQTLTQHCKSTILQLKSNMIGEKKDWYISLYVKFISKENCCKQIRLTT